MDFDIIKFFIDEGLPLVASFIAGVALCFMFMKLTLGQQIEFLKQEIRRSDEMCEKRISSLEDKHNSDMEAINKSNESSERRIIAMIKLVGEIKHDISMKD